MPLARLASQLPEQADELERVLDVLASSAADILGADLVGVYLTGSFALGGGDSASDVDFLVVAARELTARHEERIRILHRALPDRSEVWAQRLEGSWVTASALCDRPGAQPEWLYIDNGSRELERSRHDDTATERWVFRHGAIAIVGPEPATLVTEVDADAVRRDAVEQVGLKTAWLLGDPRAYSDGWAQPYIVLTFCRLIYSARTGTVTTKALAAAWVRDHVAPPRFHRLIDLAVDHRVSPPDPQTGLADPDAAAATPAFVEWAAVRVRSRD